jgi:hypothetical protein
VDRQAVPAESLGQHLQHPLRVSFLGEPDDEVVCVTDEECLATQAGLDLLLEPLIQHLCR